MSFSNKDRNLRGFRGNSFPLNPSADTVASFAQVVADALRKDFGTSPAKVKHLARLTGSNEKTVSNWLYARNGPSGAGLVVLMRHSDAVLFAVLSLAGRPDLDRGARMAATKQELRRAMAVLDTLLDHDA